MKCRINLLALAIDILIAGLIVTGLLMLMGYLDQKEANDRAEQRIVKAEADKKANQSAELRQLEDKASKMLALDRIKVQP